ncbi:hypothetical protein PMIN06_009062 [Paraphaeosphaeria minitans]|uniref:Uncharacterized protein n=1 Tax=Paraphaeosphaeria minitans TaxID=565426 RepID=A0A9P6G9L0_9PLEO|nr:hypothetical protein PMIN01_11224 [Paraphaeosphaeria minitans]
MGFFKSLFCFGNNDSHQDYHPRRDSLVPQSNPAAVELAALPESQGKSPGARIARNPSEKKADDKGHNAINEVAGPLPGAHNLLIWMK